MEASHPDFLAWRIFCPLQIWTKAISVQDFLDINALCAGSIAAITTGAAAIAPYGAAVHAGCANNKFLKNKKSQALLNALWTAPEFDPLKGEFPPPAPAPAPSRRLQQKPTAKQLEESLAQIAATRASLEELKKATSVPEAGNTEADTRLAILRLHISWLRISWLSLPMPMTQRFDRKMLLECQGQMFFFIWKSILAQLQLCQWPGFKHICSCDESKYAKYRVSSLNQLVLTSTWRTLDGPLCANVLDTCHMLYETAVTVDANWPRTWKHSWISWAPRRTHKDCSWNMLKW